MAASAEKVADTVIVGSYVEMETEGKPKSVKSKLSKFFWDGGSAYDAWFSCASNQVNYFAASINDVIFCS